MQLRQRNRLFGDVKLTRGAIIRNFVYISFGIAFHGFVSWISNVLFAQNVVIFGFDNTSSKHSKRLKNNCLVLGKGPIDDVNVSIGEPEKSSVLVSLNQKENFF